MKRAIITEHAPQAIGVYSQAIVHNSLLFVSGQLGLDPKTGQLKDATFLSEALQAFDNLKNILTAANSDFSLILKMTIYLLDLQHFQTINDLMAERFETPYPARAVWESLRFPVELTLKLKPSPPSANLESLACRYLHGVGPKLAEQLARCKIISVHDLLLHLPFRYEDRAQQTPIRQLTSGQKTSVVGRLVGAKTLQGRKKSQLYTLVDNSGAELFLRFFHTFPLPKVWMEGGVQIRCYGEVIRTKNGFEMFHPETEPFNHEKPLPETLTPVYPSTKNLGQYRFRKLIDQALRFLENSDHFSEYLSEDFLQQHECMPLKEALTWIHRPPHHVSLQSLETGQTPAQRRLALDELLAHHLSFKKYRRTLSLMKAPAFLSKSKLEPSFLQGLSFSLTHAQHRVIGEILQDLSLQQPMMRLVQGDVGSGKTVVAALAALRALESGWNTALMAPTEILAEQHARNFTRWFQAFPFQIALVTGKMPPARRRAMFSLAEETPTLFVGTQALFQEKTELSKLGLVVIDEQHRFGVEQRLSLLRKGKNLEYTPHQLLMTATPIPRTLAMTLYSDLDVSVLDELPPGRQPIQTVALSNERRLEVCARVSAACAQGRQAYWICPLIENSEELSLQAMEELQEILGQAMPDITIGTVHGKMKPREKDTMLRDFYDKKFHLLLATTVVEVGIDVPNASIMIIENAERFGLSQLHQLRGRVGRGNVESMCILLYQKPLSLLARSRLEILRCHNDGFVIAEKDLELRGPGEVLGTRQTGTLAFKTADLGRDQSLLPLVHSTAQHLLDNRSKVVEELIQRWLGKSLEFVEA